MTNTKQPVTGSASSPNRLLALTDGVFAVVMTLLVLGLTVPVLKGSSMSQDADQLLEMWPQFACYFVTFVISGFIWTVHHYLFGMVNRADSVLVWINIIFLMFVSLLPFSTSLMAANFGHRLPTLIYEDGFLVCQLAGFLSFSYVTGRYRLTDTGISAHEIRARRASWIMGIALVAIAIGALWIGVFVSMGLFVLFLFMDLAFMIVRFRVRASQT